MNPKLKVFCCLALLLLFTGGCIQEETIGSEKVFTYEWWVPLSVLAVGVIGAPAGWFLRNKSERIGWGLMIVAPIAAIFFAPSLFLDRAVVGDSAYSLRTGIWGMTAVHEVKYEDLDMIRITSEEVRGRRGRRRTNYYLRCERKDGSSAKVPVNSGVSEAAAPHFLERAEQLGILIVNETS